nr:YolD-like family protein [Bacillus thuringiensis]
MKAIHNYIFRIPHIILISIQTIYYRDEILITYYEDGYLLSSYMTVVDIHRHSLNTAVICTDVFYNKMPLQFSNITDVK